MDETELSKLREIWERVTANLDLRRRAYDMAIATWGETPTAIGPKRIVEDMRRKRDQAQKEYDEVVAQL